MPIYTRKGDKGFSVLIGGKRVAKNDLRIAAMGEIDELNASIGVLRTQKPLKKNAKILEQIQSDLFTIGAELADPGKKLKMRRIGEKDYLMTEEIIDSLGRKLPRLNNFILPDGLPFSAHAHLSRTVCRRAERAAVALNKKEKINPQIIIYLNRLSDLLFMFAREHMFDKKKKETLYAIH